MPAEFPHRTVLSLRLQASACSRRSAAMVCRRARRCGTYSTPAVVRTSLLETRQKVRNLHKENPSCNLFIFEEGNPFKTIELRGQATLEPDPDGSFMARILRHYGHDPDTFPDDRSVERVVLTLTPSRVVASG